MSSTFKRRHGVKAVVCAVAALSISGSGAVFAQPRDDRGPDRHDDRHDDRRGDRRDDHRDDRRGPDRRPGPPPREVVIERGAGPGHDFRRGGRLPSEYRSRQYVVDDWRGHHLRQPPRGYHWVQTGGDYVLAAIATGIIADILLNQ